jgi:O-antigen/teichoic acid export membrane protein
MSALLQSIRRLPHTAVAWGFVGTGIRSAGGLLLLPLLVKLVPSEDLGVWYVFVGMSSLVLMLNAGLTLSLTRCSAYLWTGSRELKAFGISTIAEDEVGSRPNADALRDLVATLRALYAALGAACLLLFITAGSAWIWHITSELETRRALRAAWLVYTLGFSLNFNGAFWMPLLSGINRVVTVERIMTAASVANISIAAAGLALRFEVWALVAGMLVMGSINWIGARYCFFSAAADAMQSPRSGRIHLDMLRAIWPTSWRTAACAGGAYLAMPATVFIASAFLGLGVTASFGLTIQLLSKLVAVSVIWVRVKLPVLSQLRVQRNAQGLALIFAQRIRLCLLTGAAGIVAMVLIIPTALNVIGANTHLLPLPQLLVLCAVVFLQMQQSQYAALVLTENENPFAMRAVITGIAVFSIGWSAAQHFGMWGLVLCMLLIPVTYNNWSIPARAVAGLGVPRSYYWQCFFKNWRNVSPVNIKE